MIVELFLVGAALILWPATLCAISTALAWRAYRYARRTTLQRTISHLGDRRYHVVELSWIPDPEIRALYWRRYLEAIRPLLDPVDTLTPTPRLNDQAVFYPRQSCVDRAHALVETGRAGGQRHLHVAHAVVQGRGRVH